MLWTRLDSWVCASPLVASGTFKMQLGKAPNAALIVAAGGLLLAACSPRRVPAIAAILDIPDIRVVPSVPAIAAILDIPDI